MNIEAISRGAPVIGVDPFARFVEGVPVRDIILAVQAANKSELYGDNRELSFTRDIETRRVVIEIRDRESGELLRQIPPKEFLDWIKAQRRNGRPDENE